MNTHRFTRLSRASFRTPARWASVAGLALGFSSLLASPSAVLAQPENSASDKVAKNTAGEPVNEDTKKVYVVTLRGSIGREVTATPFRQVIADIKRQQPDFVVFRLDFAAQQVYGQVVANTEDKWVLGELESSIQLATLFNDDLEADATWVKKPKIVMWVRHALGGASFLPFAAQDVFFTSDGLQGGMAGLEMGWQGFDQRVKEKMIGIFSAHAKGLAERSQHPTELLTAMMKYGAKLSVDNDGTLHEDYSGSYKILKEDPLEDENRRDSLEQIARNQGNDLLVLDAPTAKLVGLSKETADSLDEIMIHYGFERNYSMTEGRSRKIFENWIADVRKAENDFLDMWRAFNEIQVEGATPQERNQRRGAQIGTLTKIRNLLGRYKEAINPRAIRGAPENWDTQLDIMIEQIRQQMRVDK